MNKETKVKIAKTGKPKTRKPNIRKTAPKRNKNKKQKRSYLGLIMILFLLTLITLMIFRNCQKPSPIEEEVVEELSKVEASIRDAANQLGVPDNLYRKNVRDDGIHISIALNPDMVDLVFANMIVTGRIELAGGKIVSGTETSGGSAHFIRIHDPKKDKDYIVRLYFDQRSSYPHIKPKLAIIVDDFGEFAGPLLDDFLQTDPNVTFSILPDLRYSRTVMDRAIAMGREVMLHIPMEPVNYPRVNPGNNPILVEHSDREISRIIDGYVRHLPRVSGANNHMGSLATADERVMAAVLNGLAKHNLFFVDSKTTQYSVAVDIAQILNVPVAQRDLFLDDPDSSERIIRERLRQLQALKGQKDQVVAITHCFDKQRLEMLNLFIEEAIKIGFEIVPASQLFVSDLPEIL